MGRWHFALLQLGVWTAYAAVHFAAALPAVAADEVPHLAGWKLVRAATGCLVSSFLPWIYRRVPGLLERPTPAALAVAVVSYGMGMLWTVVDRSVLVTVAANTPLDVNWERFPRGLELDYPFVMLAWSAGWLTARYRALAERRRREALEQEVAAREARLQALAARLHPHFLFNTLNSVRALAVEDAQGAREMISRLSDLLRHALEAREVETLGRELAAVRAYLGIQTVRFAHRLEAVVESSERAERCLVPALVLQPLVENAIEHGTPPPSEPLRVRVRAAVVGTTLRIEVESPGELSRAPGAPEADGRGLAAVQARLARAFGERHAFSLVQRGGLVVATIEISGTADGGPARPDR